MTRMHALVLFLALPACEPAADLADTDTALDTAAPLETTEFRSMSRTSLRHVERDTTEAGERNRATPKNALPERPSHAERPAHWPRIVVTPAEPTISSPTTAHTRMPTPEASNPAPETQHTDSPKPSVEVATAATTTPPTCEVFEQQGCYWMENTSGNDCWVPVDGTDAITCQYLDSCSGGEGYSGGGCYKWSEGSKGTRSPWLEELPPMADEGGCGC